MKRSVIIAAILAGLVVFLLCWRASREGMPTGLNTVNEAPVLSKSNGSKVTTENNVEPVPAPTKAELDYQRFLRERPESAQAFKMQPDLPVAFYGLVVDQDSNGLQGVKVDVEVMQWYVDALPDFPVRTARVEKQTDADGRFSVSAPIDEDMIIRRFSNDVYELEMIQREYGVFDAQAGSFDQPKIFRLWSTNLHGPLISGEKKFQIVPDGRRYGIDLIKGEINEGNGGDLVVWIKRAESVARKFDWSCELSVPNGGLLEDSNYFMFRAPEAGYTNVFAYKEAASVNGWGGATGERRFYLRLRDGQIYARIVINLSANRPTMNRLSYAVNPSGSRVLR